VTDNPLIAASGGGEASAWSGVAIAEDVEQIVRGVHDGSWVDGALGTVGAGLDALALISDPVGGLLQYGVAWLIDHVKPLSEALDWLAGDPGQIAAQAQTWRNVAGRLTDQGEELIRAVRWDVSEWEGAAGEAYRSHAGRRAETLRILSRASDGMAAMTEGAGLLIGTVRLMVRDAIATLVSRLAVYAAEIAGSLGVATPLVIEQVSTLCASWAARIGRWLRQLLDSLRRLGTAMEQLSARIRELQALRRGEQTTDLMGRRSHWADRDPADYPQAPSRTPDSHLESGDPVYHGSTSTAIGYDSQTMTNFDKVMPRPGFHDVVVHGERNGLVRPGLVGEDGDNYPANFTHPNQVAESVRNNPNYDGGPVRLIVCHSGTVDPAAGSLPVGQQMANSLGVPVLAPTDSVGVRRYGSGQQEPAIQNDGEWVLFNPQMPD
jgi:hypothetical protein